MRAQRVITDADTSPATDIVISAAISISFGSRYRGQRNDFWRGQRLRYCAWRLAADNVKYYL